MYLMECILWKIQYVGKSDTPFNLRLNNHRKYVNNPKAIPACNHFKIHDHNFMKHAKFTLIEPLTEISNVSTGTLRLRLKWWEDFWIIKLETVAPKGLSEELNNVWSLITAFSVHSILILQLGRKRCHYDISPNIWRQIKICCNH